MRLDRIDKAESVLMNVISCVDDTGLEGHLDLRDHSECFRNRDASVGGDAPASGNPCWVEAGTLMLTCIVWKLRFAGPMMIASSVRAWR